jgi:hypothetical protein
MGEMEGRGIVMQRRAHIEVLDKARLKEMSCNCYRVILSAHENSLSATDTREICS